MSQIFRCDRCKKLSSDDNQDNVAHGINDCHNLKFRIDYKKSIVYITHPGLHLCEKCIRDVVAEGTFTDPKSRILNLDSALG